MIDREQTAKNFAAMPKADIEILRDWVTADDATRYDNMAAGGLRLDCSHSNLHQRYHDLLFHEEMTIQACKDKLYKHCGSSVGQMELYLRRGGGDTIFMMDDQRTLKFYGAKNGMEIFIKDNDPYSLSANGGLEDVSQVEKFELTEDQYDKKKNTVRAWKRDEQEKKETGLPQDDQFKYYGGGYFTKNGGGTAVPAEPQAEVFEDPEEVLARMPLGSRCEVDPGGRRGAVAFVGKVQGLKGAWVGVRLDEPQGLNDGSRTE
jgi:tubulin-folding cofactor B